MKKIPYRATTSTGDIFDIEFPLSQDTGDAVRVSQLISEILLSIDRTLAVGTPTPNGDVLQAIAMAMSVRARMIHAPTETSSRLAMELLSTALAAAGMAGASSAAYRTCLVGASNSARRICSARALPESQAASTLGPISQSPQSPTR